MKYIYNLKIRMIFKKQKENFSKAQIDSCFFWSKKFNVFFEAKISFSYTLFKFNSNSFVEHQTYLADSKIVSVVVKCS